MKTIRVTTTSKSWITSANGEQEDFDNYFLNQWFDVGVYPVEKMEKCIKVEILNTYLASFRGCRIGAIGLEDSFKDIEVMGADDKDARLSLYDNFEHIQYLKLQKV